MSAVEKGYYKDDFIRFFVPKTIRRPPLINRGYYSRVEALRMLREQFLVAGGPEIKKQIVVLGAGLDTLYFNLKSQGRAPHGYFEVDFPEVTGVKSRIIGRNKELHQCFSNGADSVDTEAGTVTSADYSLIACDLRNLQGLEEKLAQAGLDFTIPTLFVSECVLIYMSPEQGSALIEWVAKRFTAACFATYEQIKPNDAFGQTMVSNLAERGLSLASLSAFPGLAEQRQRYLDAGFGFSEALDMDEIYSCVISLDERRRVDRLELFDEVEEWRLIQQHYCIVFASRDASSPEGRGLFSGYGLVKQTAPVIGGRALMVD